MTANERYKKTEKGKIAYRKYHLSEAYALARKSRESKPKFKYSWYKSCARSRDIKFCLSMEEFMVFWQKPCSYCGDSIATAGLDRKDSGIGYVVSNINSCCWKCNRAKADMSVEDYISHCKKVSLHIGGQNGSRIG